MLPENNKRPGEGASRNQAGTERSASSNSVGRRLLHSKEAAHYIGVGTRTLWTLANLRRIPTVRFGTGGRESVRFDVLDLDAWIEEQKGGQA